MEEALWVTLFMKEIIKINFKVVLVLEETPSEVAFIRNFIKIVIIVVNKNHSFEIIVDKINKIFIITITMTFIKGNYFMKIYSNFTFIIIILFPLDFN